MEENSMTLMGSWLPSFFANWLDRITECLATFTIFGFCLMKIGNIFMFIFVENKNKNMFGTHLFPKHTKIKTKKQV